MADKLGELFVEIVADTKKFDKGVDSAEKGTKKFKGGLDNLSGTVKKLLGAGALIAVAAKVADIGKAAIDAASRAEETRAKFNTAFRGIETLAADTAKSLAESYGLSTTESENLLGSTGDLLKGFGATATEALGFSNEIQKLSVDLASYNNVQGGAERVSRILTKSVLGNKDGLSELGVSLLDVDIKQELVRTGQDKLTGQAGKLAKAQATFNLILQQTGDAQGDYIRTSDSYANVTRRAEAATKDLQAELGRALLPTATSVKSIFGELTVKLSDYLEGLNDLKALELAQEQGIATREEELNLLQLNLEVLNRKKDTQDKINAADIRAEGIITTQNKIETEKLNIQINSTAFRLSAIEDEKLAEAELAEQKAEEAEQERLRLEAEKDAEKIRQENYKASLTAIDDIIETNKTQIQIIDEEILALQNLSTESEEADAKRIEAIGILTAERKAALKEIQGDEDAFLAEQEEIAEKLRLKKEEENQKEIDDARILRDEKIQLRQDELDFIQSAATSINSIWQNVNQGRINTIESEKNAQIAALDEELLGTEEYNRKKKAIEKKAADEAYDIKLAEFRVNQALAISQIAIDTAIGVAKVYGQTGIFGLGAQVPVIAAGVAQAAVVLSQPEPPRPQLATGAIIPGSQRGTNVTVGESGNDELILGGGSKGEAILNRFADKINTRGGGGGLTVNFYGKSMTNRTELDMFARDLYQSNVKELQRRGVQ